jgi:hypothetical protein
MIVNNELNVGTSGCGLRVGALRAVAWRFSESAIDTVFTTCYNSKQIKTQIFSLKSGKQLVIVIELQCVFCVVGFRGVNVIRG